MMFGAGASRRRGFRVALLMSMVAIGAASAVASAQEPSPADTVEARPWAEGVAELEQAEALRLFDEANELFLRESYVDAKRMYEKALGHWEHPSIQYNLSECLIHLDRPIEAYEQLLGAMRFGEAPLGASVFQRAQTHKKLLESQLAVIGVSAAGKGVTVTLNGTLLFTAPGKAERRVRPGHQQLTASKAGFATYTQQVLALPGKPLQVNIELKPLGQMEIKRRYPVWVPWTTAAAGAAMVLGGVGLQLKATSDIDKYDRKVGEQCPVGCPEGDVTSGTRKLKDNAELESTIGISMIAVGGAALVTGVVLLVLNDPETVATPNKVRVSPAVSGDGVGVTAHVRF